MVLWKQQLSCNWEGVKFNLIISNDLFVNYFLHKYNVSKTLLKSTVWNKTQARLHHDQRDGPETLSRWRKDIWKCSGQSRNFFSWLIVRSCPKQAKVENKEIVLSLVKQAKVDKENWQIKKSEGKKKSKSFESTNQTTQTKNCHIKIMIETKVQNMLGFVSFAECNYQFLSTNQLKVGYVDSA